MKIDPAEIRTYLEGCGPNSKIYLGADSERFKKHGKWYADYMLVCVIHIDGHRGCKIFGEVQTDVIHEAPRNPLMRLRGEYLRVAELYQRLESVFADLGFYDIEIHLDINSDDSAVSNQVMNEAIGYIKAMCQIVPMTKPNAPCASFAADRLKQIMAA